MQKKKAKHAKEGYALERGLSMRERAEHERERGVSQREGGEQERA